MPETEHTDLNALLGSRICHDLISPLGAIGNGLELLELSGRLEGPEFTLIAESVAAANARVRLFRIAFGTAGAGQAVGRTELEAILEGSFGALPRLRLRAELPKTAPRPEVKLALLALLCLETALPRGGILSVTADAGGNWVLTADGPGATLDPELWPPLSGLPAGRAPSAAEIQFALLPAAARAAGRALSTEHAPDGTICLRF